jgi:hypothetical protein
VSTRFRLVIPAGFLRTAGGTVNAGSDNENEYALDTGS